MYSITYFWPNQKILYAVTTPNEWVAADVADGLGKLGAIVRLWTPKKTLVNSHV